MREEIYRISVILTPEPEGGYTVTCRELPELITYGDSFEKVWENVADAFVATLELYQDMGRELPDSIRMKNVSSRTIKTVRFETMTPPSKPKPIPTNNNLWFQAVLPGSELRVQNF